MPILTPSFCHSGSNDSKDCEYRKAYKNYQQRVRNKELELESSKRMTFEKLLEEQRHRLHSVGGKCPDNGASGGGGEVYFDENVITTPHDDLPTTPAATTGGVSGGGTSPPNDEFYRVFSRVRSKSHSNSETSDEAAQRN